MVGLTAPSSKVSVRRYPLARNVFRELELLDPAAEMDNNMQTTIGSLYMNEPPLSLHQDAFTYCSGEVAYYLAENPPRRDHASTPRSQRGYRAD